MFTILCNLDRGAVALSREQMIAKLILDQTDDKAWHLVRLDGSQMLTFGTTSPLALIYWDAEAGLMWEPASPADLSRMEQEQFNNVLAGGRR